MATNRQLEMVIGATYPNSMKHLQQLIMDAEDCAKNIGKKTLLGKDKFEPCFDKFKATMTLCFKALAADNQIDDPENIGAAVTALNLAVSRCEKVYSSWPLAFKFWHELFPQLKDKQVHGANNTKLTSKADEMESIASQFDSAKEEFLWILIMGLSNEDQRERESCAEIIREQVIPALELDKGAASKAFSLATIQKLTSELRPPKDKSEMNDLDHAVFLYILQLLNKGK